MPPIRLPEVLAALPIFPLPNLVLLPGEMVPLHVFEPRYQALIAHCMENDRVLGMATLVPGFEQEYEGRPPVFPEVAVAAILQHQPLPEGRSNLLIQSVARIRLVEELPATRLFREIRGTVCEEVDDRPSLAGLRSMIAEGNIDGTKTVLVKPTTYMNASGEAVRMVIDRFHIPAASILVISDDVDLPLGSMRYRTEGGPGGHNGLKSLISCFGTQMFARLKIGVGAPPEHVALEDYVLGKFIKEEHGVIDRVVAKALEVLDTPSAPQETTWTVPEKA